MTTTPHLIEGNPPTSIDRGDGAARAPGVGPSRGVSAARQASASAGAVRRHGRPGRVVLALAILLGAVGGGWFAFSPLQPGSGWDRTAVYEVQRRSFPIVEQVKGELKAANTTDIKSKVEGRATIIWLIDEGTTVAEGDLLVKLASDEIEERIRKETANEASAIAALEAAEKDLEILIDENESNVRKAQLKLELAEIEREKYFEGDAKKQFMEARLDIERAEQMYARALDEFENEKDLFEQKFTTQSKLDQKEFELHEAERAVEKAKLSLEVLEKYTHPKELRQRNSDVKEAEKELERVKKSATAKEAQKRADVEAKRANLLSTQNELSKLREQKEYTEIRAPSPGLVVYYTGHRWNPERITVGSEVHERQTIVTLPDPSVMVVSVRIHEAKTHRIELGQRVQVEIDAIPGKMFSGEITKMAPLADSRNSWLNPDLKEYETEITLDQHDENLKPGLTARAEIIVDHLDDVLCVPTQAVFSKAGHHFVFRSGGTEVEPVEVKLGPSSTEYVQIESGLSAGDEVLLAVSEADRAKMPDVARDDAAKEDPGKLEGHQAKSGGRSESRSGRARPERGGS